MKITSLRLMAAGLVSLVTACAPRVPIVELYGQPAPVAAAQATIVITPVTRHVNVEGGQIIRFVVDGKEFAWNFNTASSISSFSLNAVAPVGMLNQPVRAYVSPDPKYMSGGDRE